MIRNTCPYCGRDLIDANPAPTHYLICTCGKAFTATEDADGNWVWLPGIQPHPDLAPKSN